MATSYRATKEKRQYNRWVANETKEDFALRFTAHRARRWSYGRVANTAIGSISFLALEAIGAALTLSYGFDIAVTAIMLVGAFLFITAFPISYYAARYGVDIDLLTRGAGFGYIGSTITSLIYATFTFIFFALEAAILALALEYSLGIPLVLGYLISAVVVIPLVINGFSKISAFQAWTQPIWVLLHMAPFVILGFVGYDLEAWSGFQGDAADTQEQSARLIMLGAAAGVIFSLIAQVGEQVDYLRFLPVPRTAAEKRRWWAALIIAGPGWSVLGMMKMLAGSYLAVIAIASGLPEAQATDPTRMYETVFAMALDTPWVVILLTSSFVILSQLKINVTNAYAGSIAWSNFFSRLTHAHPGRVVWLVFNVGIALMLMELGVFGALEATLTLYSHVALAWIGALVADLVINKPLGLSPPGIEFRRAHLYDFNPVGIGAMITACVLSLSAFGGVFGPVAEALSSFIALGSSFLLTPVISLATRGRYYIARPALTKVEATCIVCDYRFDPPDMTHCPFHEGPICSLCCTLDSNCRDACKPHGRLDNATRRFLEDRFPAPVAQALMSRMSRFVISTTTIGAIIGLLLVFVRDQRDAVNFDAILWVVFSMVLIVVGICVWMYLLISESQQQARSEAEKQSERLLFEVRAHERTDRKLQQAKEKAEAANTAKTRYMTGLSHELRTPLNSIYGFAQILERDEDIPIRRRNSITTIRRSSEHLAGLIEGLLDISRIEAGRLKISRDRINLRVFLQQVSSIFKEAAREKNLTFTVDVSKFLPVWIVFDEKRLRQIFINLLSNAIRYTDAGQVSLRITYRNEVAVIEVRDTGCGIMAADHKRIWDPFERGNNTVAQGSGLGLTITKLLVEILGGEIEMESTPGLGSVFRVRLMLPSVPADGRDTMSSPAVETQSLSVAGVVGPRRTLLVVDDDANHLNLVDSFLSPLGFAVLTATTAEQALTMLEDITPDLFVLDIDLPGLDGYSLAEKLRKGDHRSSPIIMISGHAMDTRAPSTQVTLCDTFIAKPYNLDDLLLRIAEILRVELVYKQKPASHSHESVALSDAERRELISLARNGMARALTDRIADLAERGSLRGPMLVRLNKMASVFDLPGIAEILEEDVHDATD
ncbi:hybrid sensor histidine kinase/response regulator [Roseobacter denitrificans]|uniref:histidine kinase n=1 Tax=Roseobacter denitrificans (strain ATCC 33942 / OCh 114) TaxID=375451 RepID=Q162L9_ROSDO|nr:ATP-binding protein [Roseobacter denitrificans]ABG33074.1 two-component hybrid sensor and regulator, putative [Roseobacter denitrificans OCh 114]AVL52446.1 hybrid sensor histidine kinase/response regulator [Roseobacter denitrificans]SFG08417.1 Signal transduction histidine kinase [Roseobacter denitrificans OCh 114]